MFFFDYMFFRQKVSIKKINYNIAKKKVVAIRTKHIKNLKKYQKHKKVLCEVLMNPDKTEKIERIVSSFKDKEIKNKLRKLLIKYELEGNTKRIALWDNIYLLSEGDIEKFLEHLRYEGSGRILEKEDRLQCDGCGTKHLVDFHKLSYSKKGREDYSFILGGTCLPNLKEDFAVLGIEIAGELSEEQKKEIEKKKKEVLEEFSAEQFDVKDLEEYKEKLREEINTLITKRKIEEDRLNKLESKGSKEIILKKEIDNKKSILRILDQQIAARNVVLQELESENIDLLLNAWSVDKSLLQAEKSVSGAVLTSLEDLMLRHKLNREQEALLTEFKYSYKEIDKGVLITLKNIWARNTYEPKKALLGSFEDDIRLLHHINNIVDAGLDKKKYLKKLEDNTKKFLDNLDIEDMKKMNKEFIETRKKEIEILNKIKMMSIERIKELNELAGHVDYDNISDIIDKTHMITRLDSLKVYGALKERARTRDIINENFLNKFDVDFDKIIEKWLNVYKKDKEIKGKLYKKGEKDDDFEKNDAIILGKKDYSLLKRINTALKMANKKSIKDIVSGFSIIEFEKILYNLLALERKEKANAVKNSDLIPKEIFVEIINKHLLAENKDIYEENIDTIIDKIQNSLIMDDNLQKFSDDLKKDPYLQLGLIDKKYAERFVTHYKKVKNFKQIDEQIFNTIKEVSRYVVKIPQIRTDKKYFSESMIERYKKFAEQALEISKELSEEEKKAGEFFNKSIYEIDNTKNNEFHIAYFYKNIKRIIKDKFEIYDKKELLEFANKVNENYIDITEMEIGKKLKALANNYNLELYLKINNAPDVESVVSRIKTSEVIIVKKEQVDNLEKVIKEAEEVCLEEEKIKKIRKEYENNNLTLGFGKYANIPIKKVDLNYLKWVIENVKHIEDKKIKIIDEVLKNNGIDYKRRF